MKNLKNSLLKKILRKRNEAQPSFVFPAFLLPEEKIIFKINPHWLFVVVPEVAIAISGFLIVKYLLPLAEQFQFKEWFLSFFSSAWVFVMVVIFFYWLCIRYYLTNLRLIEERGIIGKRIMSIWLDKVQDLTTKFGIWGRIFGFGDIEIQSAGTYGKIVFDFIPNPRKLQKKIEKEILKSRQHPLPKDFQKNRTN